MAEEEVAVRWQKNGSVKVRKLTKKLAIEFRDMPAIPRDRPKIQRLIEEYTEKAKKGEIRTLKWARAAVVETNELIRINGKHTSTVLSEIDPPNDVEVVIEDFICQTMSDAAALYGSYDQRHSGRTTSNVNAPFAGAIKELEGVSQRLINAVISGMAYRKDLGAYSRTIAVKRAEKLEDEVDFALFVNRMCYTPKGQEETSGVSPFAKLCRFPIVAAMFGTYKMSKVDAERFWTAVRDENNPRANSADRNLAMWLNLNSLDSSPGAADKATSEEFKKKNLARKAVPREFYVRCILAWNAWCRGSHTKTRYNHKDSVPLYAKPLK